MPRLENWTFWGVRYVSGMKYSLIGLIYDDPRFVDGVSITTSPVAFYSVDKETGTHYVTTKNGTVYQLGRPLSQTAFGNLHALPKEV